MPLPRPWELGLSPAPSGALRQSCPGAGLQSCSLSHPGNSHTGFSGFSEWPGPREVGGGLTPEKPAQHLASHAATERTRRPGWDFLSFIISVGYRQTFKFSAIIYNSNISYLNCWKNIKTEKLKHKERLQKGGYYNISRELKFKISKTPHIGTKHKASNFPVSL